MRMYDIRWRDKRWYHRDDNGKLIIHDDAPQYVKESYKNYVRQMVEYAENHPDLLNEFGIEDEDDEEDNEVDENED